MIVFLKGVDNHIPNVPVIIDDDNVASTGPSFFDHPCFPRRADVSPLPVLIVTSLRRCVGNVYYRVDTSLLTRMFWEGEKRRAPGPTDNIRKIPPRGPAESSIVTCRRPRAIKPARSNSRAAFVTAL